MNGSMGDAVGGREAVGERIDQLDARYGDFAINQTTVSVSAEGYEQARDRADDGLIDAYVRVWNEDDEAVHLRCDGAFRIDAGEGTPSLEARVRRAVRTATDLEATVEDVSRVTIAGIRNDEDDADPAVYRLFVLFDANHTSGDPDEIEWQAEASIVPEFVGGA
jgi:hypothetical protein